MRISPHKPKNTRSRERYLLLLGLLSIILLLFWALLPVRIPSIANAKANQLSCGAEYVQNDVFVDNGQPFEGVQYQSRLRSRNGLHSILLPADSETHFGFTTILDNVQAGQVYDIAVWSFDNPDGNAKLAVQGREPGGFYLESTEISEIDDQGWSQHRMRVVVPFQDPPSQLAVYVYNKGQQAIFFDDLSIRPIAMNPAEGFYPARLELNIDGRNWDKLEQKRTQALQSGLLQSSNDDWVNARLTDNDWQREVKIRLKGDWLDHLRGNKWSFRIKLKGADSWRGLKTFSLHTPAARYYLHEWLLHQYWKHLGVLTTDYDFVELIINGESRGIYAYEEHFEKQLLESQERREGPIVKFAEEGFWAGIGRQLQHHGFVRSGSGLAAENPANAPLAAFNQEELEMDTTQAKLLHQALRRLAAYQEGAAPASEVFDLPLLARYYAGCDLLNAYHGIVWHNQRFYYNPITTQLEPIGFDGFAEAPAHRLHFLAEGALQRQAPESTSLPAYFLRDSAFICTYIATLDTLSRPSNWNGFIESILPAVIARQQYLSSEFPDYKLDLESAEQAVAFVRSHLLPFSENCIRSFRLGDREFVLENTHTLPLLIHGYGSYSNQMTTTLEKPLWLPAGPVRALYSRLSEREQALPFREISFWDQQAQAFQEAPTRRIVKVAPNARFLFVQPAGIDTLLSVQLNPQPWDEGDIAIGNDQYRIGSNPVDFAAFNWNESRKEIIIPAGNHVIRQDLIIPAGYSLRINAGARIQLDQQAAIIAYGSVRALGEEGQIIEIFSQDGTGQGLQVIQSPTASILRGVVFRGLSNLKKTNWELTGAVTFYESAVQIENCRFLDNHSEDALNIIRSEFTMNRSLVQNTTSDGLDADFCKGTINACQFINTTNDGVDFSGSIISLKKVRMESCGDKGVSAGEASDITVIDALISDCNIGLASKDQSTLHARELTLRNCKQGFVVFQKKPEYGPAYLLVDGLKAENNQRLYQIAPGSRLQIDDELIFE